MSAFFRRGPEKSLQTILDHLIARGCLSQRVPNTNLSHIYLYLFPVSS